MPTILTTARRVQVLVARELAADLDRVTPDARLQGDLGADQLDVIGLAMEIEDEFQITLTDDQVEEIGTGTVADIVALVDAGLALAEAA